MKYLSWDIGIKNLSYCIVEKIDNKYKILNWEIINLGEKIQPLPLCQGIKKNNDKCTKTAFGYNFNQYLCKTHMKDKIFINLKTPKCCYSLKDNILCNKKVTFKNKENEYIGYCTKHMKNFDINNFNKVEKKKDKKNELEMISENLINELDNRKFMLDVDVITIENQPAFKNPKMKSIQMIIYTYFLMRGRIDTQNKIERILFLSANNKLKIKLTLDEKETTESIENKKNIENSIVTKNKYKKNKDSAKLFCAHLLESIDNDLKSVDNNLKSIDNNLKSVDNNLKYVDNYWLDYFNNHKKKDDLADTFLMNIYQIQIDNKI